MQLYGVLGDLHLPWANDRKIELAYCVMKDVGITHLILNGDVADFYNLNAHGPKDPQIKTKLDDEFDSLVEFLQFTRKFFGHSVKIIYIFGNHEHRLDRFVMANCPAFYNHLRLDKMLQLDSLGIDWIPYNQPYLVKGANLRIQHSPPSYSENLANTSLKKKIDVDHIFNCAHRLDFATRTGASGKDYTVISNGWFGSLEIIRKNQNEMPENRRVYHFTKFHESWNTAFTLAYVYKHNHTLNPIHIKQGEKGEYYCSTGANYYEL